MRLGIRNQTIRAARPETPVYFIQGSVGSWLCGSMGTGGSSCGPRGFRPMSTISADLRSPEVSRRAQPPRRKVTGLLLVVSGSATAFGAWLATAVSSGIHRWQLVLFGLGLLTTSWGSLLIPSPWQRPKRLLVIIMTPLLIAATILLAAHLPT